MVDPAGEAGTEKPDDLPSGLPRVDAGQLQRFSNIGIISGMFHN
jgi:hypothetical protein